MGFLDILLGGLRSGNKTVERTLHLRREVTPLAPEPSVTFYPEWETPDGVEGVRALPLSTREREAGEIPPKVDARLQVLANLSFEGSVFIAPGCYQLPLDTILNLEEEDRDILGLSVSIDWKLNIDVSSVIGKGNKPLSLRWTAPDGTFNPSAEQFIPVSCGFYEPERDKLHVLPPELIEIREKVGTAQPEIAEVSDEYQMLGELQKLVEDAQTSQLLVGSIERSGQLESEDYIAPGHVEIDIRPTQDGGLNLRPILPGFDNFDDAEELLNASDQKRLFSRDKITAHGKRKVRIALSPTVRREVARIRRRSHVPREQIADFIRDPHKFLYPPEERLEERKIRAEQLGISEDEAAELEQAEEVIDTTSLPDRFAELRLEDYGPRVEGFAEAEPVKLRPAARDGMNLEPGWLSDESLQDESDISDPGSAIRDAATNEFPEDRDSQNAADSSDATAGNFVLLTSDNDAALTYEAKISLQLRRKFEEFGNPRLFKGKFYPHQEIGYAWLRDLADIESERGAGGLLADDMGLGKTIQVIGLFAHLKAHDQLGPSLLVVPKTVIRNWKYEIQSFCPSVQNIYEYIGGDRRKNLAFLRERDIIITTYDTLRIDQLLLGKIEFQVMVCDEAQYIKNYSAGRASACRAMNAKLRISLTATPVENSLDELWSIVDYSQPGHLGDITDFRERYTKRIESEDLDEAKLASRELQEKLSAHYLRRTKEDELGDELPDKIPACIELQLTDLQLRLYQQVKTWYGQQNNRGNALGAIQSLLRISAHPLALTEKSAAQMGLDSGAGLGGVHGRANELIAQSAKTQYLFDELSKIREHNEKAIIFTGYRSLQLLLQALIEETTHLRPHIVNGKVSGHKRHELIDGFNTSNGFNVIIMSAAAAGVGINVTGANHVIHITREWNPAKENQATDRAYRIGQTKDVYVHTPVTTHSGFETIDVKLNHLLSAKLDLAKQVIRPSDSLGISPRELEGCLVD